MATAVDRHHQIQIAPAETEAATAGGVAPAQKRSRGWIKRMYSPVVAEKGTPVIAAADDEDDGSATRTKKPSRRGGWLRRLMAAPSSSQRRRRKLGGGGEGGSAAAASRLLAGLLPTRWNRGGVSLGGAGGWASAVLDAAAFRVMYVVEAVVLGLALSCFFCCCGCQI